MNLLESKTILQTSFNSACNYESAESALFQQFFLKIWF